jgi:hypothetical protein
MIAVMIAFAEANPAMAQNQACWHHLLRVLIIGGAIAKVLFAGVS